MAHLISARSSLLGKGQAGALDIPAVAQPRGAVDDRRWRTSGAGVDAVSEASKNRARAAVGGLRQRRFKTMS